MFHSFASARRVFSLGMLVCLTAFVGLGYAALTDIEGTQGHTPIDGLPLWQDSCRLE
jgi:hypothetical protein